MSKRPIRRAATLALLLMFGFFTACGGGGSSSSPATAGKTGSVGVVLTDAPADPSLFSSINATIERVELIGADGGRFALFDGPAETFDLLRLRNQAVPFTFHDEVPVGTYCKIRLTLSNPNGLELVLAEDGSSRYPRLPGNGKLDLLARDCFTVAPGASVTLQLDMDAGNSIHIVQNGNNTSYNFRPVVFVGVINTSFTGKLMRLEGEIADVDATERTLLLCNALPTHQPNGRNCAQIHLGADSAFFDNLTLDGDAASTDDLLLDSNLGHSAAAVGLVRSLVTVYDALEVPSGQLPGTGYCRIWLPEVGATSQPYPDDVACDDSTLVLPAGTLLIDDRGGVVVDHRPQIALDGLAVEMGSFQQAYGNATTDASVDGFSMMLGAGDTLAVTLQIPSAFNGTRILSKSGELLEYSDIQTPRALKVDGVQSTPAAPLKAAVVIVDTDSEGLAAFSGSVGGLVTGGFILIPEADSTPCGMSGDLTVLLGADTSVTTVSITDTTVEVAPGGILEAGQSVTVSGLCGAGGLTAATVVIVDDQRL